jgi:1A family penicillin-binding protein
MHDDPSYSMAVFRRNLIHMIKNLASRAKRESGKAKKWLFSKHFWKNAFITVIIGFLFITGAVMLWVASLKIPDLQSFQDKVLSASTRVYDRTGQVLLYDFNQDKKSLVVPFDDISQNAKNATISIEDEKFYEHKGIEVSSIFRAIWVDLTHASLSQGGSTITQQVIKNSLLTTDKKFSRKIKEWVLALKLERVMTKDQILDLYLNSSPYGGSYYGIETASENFFGKSAKDLDVAEAAYLAAIPQAPTYYSPYGPNKDALESRKNLVLLKMKENGYISTVEYNAAKAEKIAFKPQQNNSIKAPHFVMFIRDYLIQKYGEDVVNNGNLKVVTTLDYDLETTAEGIVKDYALRNEKNFNATNAGLVAIDPTTGQILVMVGSRDYFDKKIDGQFNVTTAHRQPGSSFKPFAYATAFEKGYTPDTMLFDLPTQFSVNCDADGVPLPGHTTKDCYMPQNYDSKFLGPISLRNAIAQSRNIPSIKVLYLAGIKDTIQTAEDLGITSLTDPNRYGLTLVLGGGEVSPLEMTSAYGVFANNGVRNPYTGILSVTDKDGNNLEKFTPNPTQGLPEQIALEINDVLSDNNARMPLNGPGAPTDFPNDPVALKTGTTNDYHDVWTIGYTPNIAVGAWAGNNNNAAMVHKTSGTIIAPLWRAFMNEALKKYPAVPFKQPDPIDPSLRPILRGVWQGGQTYTIDKSSGLLATDQTPPELRQDVAVPNVHTILYWIDKNNPKGPPPANPAADSQFALWEKPVQAWANAHMSEFTGTTIPTQFDNSHTADAAPHITIINPSDGSTYKKTDQIVVSISAQNRFPLTKAEFYIDSQLVGSAIGANPTFSFVPQEIPFIGATNTLSVVVYDSAQNKGEAHVNFSVK